MTPAGWGSDRARAALSLTFDNLGEAAELERGVWPEERPTGRHATVTRVLPRLLDLLDGLPVTFFVEAWNAEVYPQALRAIVDSGHEVALHGWRHEFWRVLQPEDERALVDRSLAALDALGIRPEGFRPPGGALTDATPGLLAERGFAYCSPEGDRVDNEGALVTLPFRWRAVDAYHLDPLLAGLRVRHGDAEPARTPAEGRAILDAELEDCLESRGYRALIFHPYLLQQEEHWKSLSELVARLRESTDLWVAPCRDLAHWLREAKGH